ncbi:MAG: hypothetical protein H6559_10365 [Lewinellaceae bacterium]|nr:hypothetical protein [Lewinellaceae bacterium]
MPGRGVTDIALGYSTESFSRYVFGDEQRDARLTTESMNLFVEHGFTDTLSLVVISLTSGSTRKTGGSRMAASSSSTATSISNTPPVTST